MMNRIQKQLLTLLALMGISSGLVAYEFDFMNTTEETVVLKFNTRSAANVDRYAILPPGGSTKFPVANLDCFEKVSWAPFKTVDGWGNKIPYNGGMDLVNKKADPQDPKRAIGRIEGKDAKGNDKQRLFGDQIAPAYSFYRMDVVMIPNKIFDKTVKAAEKLCSGIDSAICQVINEVKAFSATGAAEKVAKNLGGGGGDKPQTPTTPKNDIPQLINTLEEVQKIITDSDVKNRASAQANLPKIKALLTDEVKKQLETEANLALADFPTINSFYINDTNKQKALGIVNTALALLKSKTQIDLEGSIIKTSMEVNEEPMPDFSSLLSSPEPQAGSKLPLKSPENCTFGLAKIAGAAGTIAGISMCKARQFQITYTAQKGNPDLMQFEGFSSVPKLQLVTGVGE